jgi:uncharacterized protein YkuJ
MEQEESNFEQNGVLPDFIGGIKIVVNDAACVSMQWKQYKFHKSKKVRTRKKWSKRNSNFRLQEVHTAYKYQDTLFVSTRIFDKINKHYLLKPKKSSHSTSFRPLKYSSDWPNSALSNSLANRSTW